MALDLAAALVLFLVVLAMGGWQMVRRGSRRGSRSGTPLPDVPDAPPTAVPIDAPGISPPYSSLDPSAPPKRP